jgi:hypothetical protein
MAMATRIQYVMLRITESELEFIDGVIMGTAAGAWEEGPWGWLRACQQRRGLTCMSIGSMSATLRPCLAPGSSHSVGEEAPTIFFNQLLQTYPEASVAALSSLPSKSNWTVQEKNGDVDTVRRLHGATL